MDIRGMPIKITGFGPRKEVNLDIGGVPACIGEPKPIWKLYGIVYLENSDGYWEQNISINCFGREWKGCTDDPRILEIAKNMIESKHTKADIGKVYPPLK